MNLSRFRLVTFDVTGTLLKFRHDVGKQYGDIGAMYGVPCDTDSLSARFKSHWLKMTAEHPNFGKETGLGWENWWRQVVVGTFKDTKINLDDKKLEAVADHLIKMYQTSACWEQTYGALGLLSYLRHKGFPLGIISNYDPRLHPTLSNTKLRHYFSFVVISYEVGMVKPNLGIFEKAIHASQIDRLKPEECLHIGNTAVLDYQGAVNSGWNAILIHDNDKREVKEKYPFVDDNCLFASLYDLHRHFLKNNEENLLTK